jgi:hypothetical protein
MTRYVVTVYCDPQTMSASTHEAAVSDLAGTCCHTFGVTLAIREPVYFCEFHFPCLVKARAFRRDMIAKLPVWAKVLNDVEVRG